MTTTDTTYQKNADTTNPFQGNAVIAIVLAAAAQRDDLRTGIVSFQYDAERGVGILVKDAGVRQHLANALRFEKTVEYFPVSKLGTGFTRTGEIEGVGVRIWNLEP